VTKGAPSRRGRQAEASRNDERVLIAARAVLSVRPTAPMSEIAGYAGVGVATLYRRYASKQALVEAVSLDAVHRLEDDARTAVDRARSFPWAAFVGFMTGSVASGTAQLVAALAGSSSPSGELRLAEQQLRDAVADLLELTQAAGAVRPDITAEDVALLFEQLQAVQIDDKRREVTLRRRYLELALQALRAPGAAPLPGPPPTTTELLGRRYDAR